MLNPSTEVTDMNKISWENHEDYRFYDPLLHFMKNCTIDIMTPIFLVNQYSVVFQLHSKDEIEILKEYQIISL